MGMPMSMRSKSQLSKSKSSYSKVSLCSAALFLASVLVRYAGGAEVTPGPQAPLHDGILLKPSTRAEEYAFAHTPHLAVATDHRLFAMDMGNKRIVSMKLSYYAEQRAALPGQ